MRARALVAGVMLLTGCAGGAAVSATSESRSEPSSTTVSSTTSTEPLITVPTGVLAAVPFQNRLDVAQGIFQLKLYNGTDQQLDVVGVQLVWDGLTTEVSHRENTLVAGDRLDYPVSLAPANCVGDGDVADMPDLKPAVAKVHLRDGSVLDAPVYDVKHFARMLYLDDCARQLVLRTVDIEWAELHEVTLEDRPVTEGVLRITRKDGVADVSVLAILNTINYTVFAGDATPLAVMPADLDLLEVPVTFLEGRCDVHGLSESSQPYKFVVLVDLGDGVQRSVAVVPAPEDQLAMRERSERACKILDEIHFAGQS
jgi:hypothetical protein